MSENNLLEQVRKQKERAHQCAEENQTLKQQLEYQAFKMEHLKAENARLSEENAQTVRESSKLLVSGNPGAKATHLNNIKMELTTARREKHQLEEQIRAQQKKEQQMLKVTLQTYQDLLAFAEQLRKSCSMENTENIRAMPSQNLNFQSADIGFMRINELIKDCCALVSAEVKIKEGSKSSALINMSFGS